MRRIRENADFDAGQHDPDILYQVERKADTGEFSDRGRDDTPLRRNNQSSYSDNPMGGDPQHTNEAAAGPMLDRLLQMLTKAGVSTQQIKGHIKLARSGVVKVAARLGISPDQVQTYLNMLTQQLRDGEDEQVNAKLNEYDTDLAEQYYNAVQTIDEADPEAGPSNRPFDRGEYSAEPDSLGSVTVRHAKTGRSKFVQGAQASDLLDRLKARPDEQDMILAPLVEDESFMPEIKSGGGSYNFIWKGGTATAMMSDVGGKPLLRLVDVRDKEGNEVEIDARLKQTLLQQAHAQMFKE